MKMILIFAAAASLVFCQTGCSAFRAFFDESPADTQARRARVEKRDKSKAKGDADAPRDPVADALRFRPSKPAPMMIGSELNDVERDHVNSLLKGQENLRNSEMEQLHKNMRRDSDAAETWVFGGNPFKE